MLFYWVFLLNKPSNNNLFLLASQVLILSEGMLASPEPYSLVAMILN